MTIGHKVAILALSLGIAASATAGRAAPAAGDPVRGGTLFQQRCSACHSVAPGKVGAGPNLSGVYGRKAGSTAFNYSPAMKKSGLVWDVPTLDSYLASPAAKVPGSRMPINIAKADERQSIIAFLRTK